jgi:hypothetical protein
MLHPVLAAVCSYWRSPFPEDNAQTSRLMGAAAPISSVQAGLAAWLTKYNDTPWSITHLTDAQKESLIWVGISILLAIVFWKGVPFWYQWKDVYVLDGQGKHKVNNEGNNLRKTSLFLRWMPILAPVKYQTVLYHEVSSLHRMSIYGLKADLGLP